MPAINTTPTIYAEDLRAGATFELGPYTVSEAELVEFASRWDPQDFHIDKAVADAGQFGGLIASGIHTMAIYQRLSVLGMLNNWSVIAGRSIQDVRFVRPVRPGDVLTLAVLIEDVAFDDRARALVTTSAEMSNGDGDAVLRLRLDAYVRARPQP